MYFSGVSTAIDAKPISECFMPRPLVLCKAYLPTCVSVLRGWYKMEDKTIHKLCRSAGKISAIPTYRLHAWCKARPAGIWLACLGMQYTKSEFLPPTIVLHLHTVFWSVVTSPICFTETIKRPAGKNGYFNLGFWPPKLPSESIIRNQTCKHQQQTSNSASTTLIIPWPLVVQTEVKKRN